MDAIIKSDSFAHKGLGTHIVNPAWGCKEGCLYCYVLSVYRFQLGKPAKPIVHDPVVWLEQLEQQAYAMKAQMLNEKSFEPITFILSTACEPFSVDVAETSIKGIKILLEYFGQCGNVNIRIITKRLWEHLYDLNRIFISKPTQKKRMIFNISLGDFRFDWWQKIEPNAGSPVGRMELVKTLQKLGYRTAIMACPIPPGQYEQTFGCYADIIEKAEEVFCEIINPRGDNINRITESFPEVEALRTKLGIRHENFKLIETAHRYVKDHGKLRVMTYGFNFTDPDEERDFLRKYPGVRLL